MTPSSWSDVPMLSKIYTVQKIYSAPVPFDDMVIYCIAHANTGKGNYCRST